MNSQTSECQVISTWTSIVIVLYHQTFNWSAHVRRLSWTLRPWQGGKKGRKDGGKKGEGKRRKSRGKMGKAEVGNKGRGRSDRREKKGREEMGRKGGKGSKRKGRKRRQGNKGRKGSEGWTMLTKARLKASNALNDVLQKDSPLFKKL